MTQLLDIIIELDESRNDMKTMQRRIVRIIASVGIGCISIVLLLPSAAFANTVETPEN